MKNFLDDLGRERPASAVDAAIAIQLSENFLVRHSDPVKLDDELHFAAFDFPHLTASGEVGFNSISRGAGRAGKSLLISRADPASRGGAGKVELGGSARRCRHRVGDR